MTNFLVGIFVLLLFLFILAGIPVILFILSRKFSSTKAKLPLQLVLVLFLLIDVLFAGVFINYALNPQNSILSRSIAWLEQKKEHRILQQSDQVAETESKAQELSTYAECIIVAQDNAAMEVCKNKLSPAVRASLESK